MTQIVLPEGWQRPAGYSNGIVSPGGQVVHVAGQIGIRDGEQALNPEDDFAAQWTNALRRVCAVVEAAGGKPEDIAALRIYLTDIEAYRSSLGGVAAGYRETVGKHFPAMTMVQVAGLLDQAALVEIEAVAVLPAS